MPTQKKAEPLLADFKFSFGIFPNLSEAFKSFLNPSFKKKVESERYLKINQTLLHFIEKTKTPCFLLPAVLHFFEEISKHQILKDYTFESFEFWLNQSSGLNEADQALIRAKISGRFLPREAYQVFFPIGGGQRFLGSHTVTAHGSPDLDTIVSSFWGWLDAFSARLSQGQHLWNVPPGGILDTLEAPPLTTFLGKNLFKFCSQNRSSLALSASDLISQKNLLKKNLKDTTLDSEHVRHKNACMIVDEKGFFLGDLRTADYEGIRQIQSLVIHCLIWFENVFHNKFISLFTQKKVKGAEIANTLKELFNEPIKRCLDTKNLSKEYAKHFEAYLIKILGLEKGLESTITEFGEGLKNVSYSGLFQFKQTLKKAFDQSKLYDGEGFLAVNGPEIFKILSKIIGELDQFLSELQIFSEGMAIALEIKNKVFKFAPRYAFKNTSIEELRDKMSVFHHLSMVLPNSDGSLWPLGIVRLKDLSEPIMGTVSLRDFSNREEVKIASYLEIISVVDHHKVEIKTKSAPVIITGDTQSCNILLAEKNFEMNDRFPLSTQNNASLSQQLQKLLQSKNPSSIRLKQRLLKAQLAREYNSSYFVDKNRAFLEYLSYLHAIIDDTDLFSKVTPRDVHCVVELINRMKSIQLQKEVEVIEIHSLQREENFLKKAVQKIVQHPDMHSLYSQIFQEKEEKINQSIQDTASGKTFELFSDVKIQNECCRIGQTKIFSTNAQTLQKHTQKLLEVWLEKANEVYENNESIDLHIHMLSTIPNANEVYVGTPSPYLHKYCLWIWTPKTKQALEHLANFIAAFHRFKEKESKSMSYQYLDQNSESIRAFFHDRFPEAKGTDKIKTQKKMPVTILTFEAGTLNSRKAHITPFLPLFS